MKKLGNLLARFAKLEPPEKVVKKAVSECIEEVCGLKISPERISVSNRTSFLTAPSVLRHKISEDEKSICECVNRKLGRDEVVKLR